MANSDPLAICGHLIPEIIYKETANWVEFPIWIKLNSEERSSLPAPSSKLMISIDNFQGSILEDRAV
jgi:hypothetical protein